MEIEVKTKGLCDFINLTDEVEKIVVQSKVKHGLCLVFVPGSTAGITTIEWEEGALADLKEAIGKIAPQDAEYEHNKRWGDGNGFSHVRAALLKPSLVLPVENGNLVHGTWQQIVLIDFDNRPRTRKVKVVVK